MIDPAGETSTYERPFTQEGNYLVVIVTHDCWISNNILLGRLVITFYLAVLSALCCVFLYPASCLYSSKASCLLFELLFCSGSFSSSYLHYCLMLSACLFFHTLLLVTMILYIWHVLGCWTASWHYK